MYLYCLIGDLQQGREVKWRQVGNDDPALYQSKPCQQPCLQAVCRIKDTAQLHSCHNVSGRLDLRLVVLE